MKKAVRKGASKAVALVLSLAMILGMAPMVGASAGNTADAQDNFDRIVHLDMGRKYYSPEWIKALIQEISALGYTELELDFSNNEGFRFSLPAEQMQIEVGGYETVLVEVEPEEGAQDAEEPVTAVPLAGEETAEPAPTSTAQPEPEEGESEPAVTDEPESTPQYKEVEVFQSKTVDLSQALSQDGYITAEQMADIIDCADEAGIEIDPLLNSPGHMGAILSVYQEYQWTDNQGRTSESTIDLENEEAVRFAEGVVRAYAKWFAEQGCTAFNIGADEFANDIGEMGLDHIYREQRDVYSELIDYINDLAVIVQGYGMTPRAFNDSFCYSNDTDYAPSTDIQVCYWSSGWGGYSVASASKLEEKGYQLINTHGDYYYILGKDDCWDSSSKYKYDFSNNVFPGSTISDPVGSMFCIWSDFDVETEQKVAEKVRVPLRIMAACMKGETVSADTVDTSVIPGGFNADGTINTDVPSTTVEDKSGIKVTAPGLTSIKVSETTVEALQGDYVAYDMTPVAGDKNYTAEAKVSIPLGKMVNYEAGKLTGFVVESDGKITEIPGEVSGDSYVFTMPHFSVGGVMLRSGSVTETREITVIAGQTKTDRIKGENYSGPSYNTDHPEIATVTVTGQDGSEESISYSRPNVWCSQLLDRNSKEWEQSNYYCEIGDQYYPLYVQRTEKRVLGITVYTYIWGYSQTGSGQGIEAFGQQSDVVVPSMASPNIAVYAQEKGPGTEAYTDVTFHGHRAGTTYVEIGNVGYTINVLSEDLTAVTPKKLEYFITNSTVYEREDESSPSSKEIKAISDGVATEEGVALSGVAPANGYSKYDGWQALEYWKTSLLPANNRQEATSGDDTDKSLDGETVLRIRYWESKWQYQNTEENWVDIKDDDQLVAYYMKKTTVTPQIDTYGKDWGYDVPAGSNQATGDNGAAQVALSFAVVYPDGTISPSTDQVYNKTTTLFNYWDNRDFGIVMVRENDIYEASKIALVKGERETKHGSHQPWWYGDDTIKWNTEYNWETGEYELNTSNVVWTKESGTEPVLQGDKVNGGIWESENTAILVLIYLDVKTSEDNLKVQYIDDSASGKVAFEYDVAVRNTAGQDPITFVNGIKNSGEMHIGEITLSDNAYIEDATGQPQSFNKNIATVPDLAGTQYATGQYNYVRAVISNEGKTLELHYQKKAANYQFVLDYGLPIVITAEDLGILNADGITFQTSATASYGSLSCDNTQHTITYTPTKLLDGTDTFNLEIKYKDGTSQREAIDIIPASTVYYEDTEPFVTYSEGWTSLGEVSSRTQTTSKLGSGDIYGYDTAYAKDTTYSGGSAHKVTLGSGETATASFTFRGTGFQLVSATDSTSGCIIVNVNGNGVDNYYFVDCYYENGGALNQVPVMKVDGLELGTYTVTVTACYLTSRDWNKNESSTFVLDGIRIYKPVGDYENYKQDNEGSAVYSEIRNILIDGYWDPSNRVYVDTLETSTWELTAYRKVGPNNEVYLKNGDKITFTVPEGGSIVQIGAKLVSGSKMTFTVKNQSQSITSAAEMYYLLNGVKPGDEITITATEGDGILSLTNLKLVSGS